eukprot:scaffold40_cov413-Prasinococcus_capsulatus_cf.AAC.18
MPPGTPATATLPPPRRLAISRPMTAWAIRRARAGGGRRMDGPGHPPSRRAGSGPMGGRGGAFSNPP